MDGQHEQNRLSELGIQVSHAIPYRSCESPAQQQIKLRPCGKPYQRQRNQSRKTPCAYSSDAALGMVAKTAQAQIPPLSENQKLGRETDVWHSGWPGIPCFRAAPKTDRRTLPSEPAPLSHRPAVLPPPVEVYQAGVDLFRPFALKTSSGVTGRAPVIAENTSAFSSGTGSGGDSLSSMARILIALDSRRGL